MFQGFNSSLLILQYSEILNSKLNLEEDLHLLLGKFLLEAQTFSDNNLLNLSFSHKEVYLVNSSLQPIFKEEVLANSSSKQAYLTRVNLPLELAYSAKPNLNNRHLVFLAVEECKHKIT